MSGKKALLIFCVLCLVLLVTIAKQWPDDLVHIVFCDVGQGDSILITTGFTQVLIDAGPDDAVMRCLAEHIPFWDKTLELVVLTHADKDHFGGMPSVISRYSVTEMMITPWGKDTADFRAFETALSREKESGMKLEFARVGEVLQAAPDLEFTTLAPQEVSTGNYAGIEGNPETYLSDARIFIQADEGLSNARSIVLSARIDRVTFLLTGDLELDGEQALLEAGVLDEHTILKVGHHGSKTSTSADFLAALQPELAVISLGKNNSYDHPAPQVLTNLLQSEAKIVRTDQLGTIEVLTNGTSYWFD